MASVGLELHDVEQLSEKLLAALKNHGGWPFFATVEQLSMSNIVKTKNQIGFPTSILYEIVGICWLIWIFKPDAVTIPDRHFFRTVAGEDQEVSIDRFVEGCMDPPSVADVTDVAKQVLFFNIFQ